MFNFLKKLIIDAGNICLEKQKTVSRINVQYKSAKDLVTLVDQEVEKFICQSIRDRYPDHGILGEETGESKSGSKYLWVIDPIDGTTSYIHHHPFYSVSIALFKYNEPQLAAVFAPALNELFSTDGTLAFLNDEIIKVSDTAQLIQSVLATGFACLRANLEHNNLLYFNKIAPQLRDIRRFGSAALDLCYVACGRLDGFWELNLNRYDIAAGAFITEKAGGRVTDFNGKNDYPQKGIIASNPHIYTELQKNFQ